MTLMRTILKLAIAVAVIAPQIASAQTPPAPAALRLAVIPVANFTPLVVARDKGFFTEENLNVTWTTVAQGAIAVEAVYGGSAEIGGSAIFEPIVARSNGLDIMFIAASARIRSSPPDNSGLLVRSGDSIQGAKDLAGKKVSAGLINSVNYAHMREWLQRNGVDPGTVQFLEIPFPQMADALCQNRLDVVWNVEPFVTFMLKSGNARVIAYPYQENVPRMDITGYLAKESWVKANSAVPPPLQARHRPRHHLPRQCQQGGTRQFRRQIHRRQARSRGGDQPAGIHHRVQRTEPQGQSRH